MKIIIQKKNSNNSLLIKSLLLKATSKLDKYDFSEFKFVREYQSAVIRYIEDVIKAIGIGLALKLDVNPENLLKKSFKIKIDDLIKISNDEKIENEYFYKNLFDELRKKFESAKPYIKKFNFNKGKPLEPIQFKGKIIYNPETKRPLNNEEWTQITNDISGFLKDKMSFVEDDMIVQAALFGKLMQKMEAEGLNLDQQKDFTYNQIEERYGVIPQDDESIMRKFGMSRQEVKSIEYAKQHAAEYLSIKDGSLKKKIVDMVRKQIVGGLEDGISAQEMIQRLFWVDPSDMLGKRFSEDTIDAINRDWRRIALTELNTAMNNGYLAATREEAKKGEDIYFVFSGSYNPKEKPNEACNKWLGKVAKLVDEPMSSDIIKDKYTKYAIWQGKNNIGRTSKNQWMCIPVHPHCFYSGNVYTSKGWVSISKIKLNDLVLTHKGKFKRVKRIFKNKANGEYIEISLKKYNGTIFKVKCTKNHKFLTNDEWVEAQQLKINDKLKVLSFQCKDCGRVIEWNRNHFHADRCKECQSKYMIKEAWKKESYRKKRSIIHSRMMKDRIKKDTNLPKRLTENAHKKVKEIIEKNGKENFWLNSKESRHKAAISNSLNSRGGNRLENMFAKELDKNYIKYERQFSVSKYFVDFKIKKTKLLIECDGLYWHKKRATTQSIFNSRKREEIIKSFGYDVLRFTDSQIIYNMQQCIDEVKRVLMNHNNEYLFSESKIIHIKKGIQKIKRVYNLEVEDDHSYIVNGFVVKNCTHYWEKINPEVEEWDDEIHKIVYKTSKSMQNDTLDLLKNDIVKRHIDYKGIEIDIEWLKGETRTYPGSKYKNKMNADYGYIRKTDSPDGEEIDVYVNNPIKKNSKVYMINQLHLNDGKDNDFDEHKFMLGFKTKEDAKKCYINTMDKRMFGGILEIDVEDFKNNLIKFYTKKGSLMKSTFVDNVDWKDSERAKKIKEELQIFSNKVKKFLHLKNPIIVHLYKAKEKNYRARYDEGVIILFENTPDWRGDFLHELGHQIIRLKNINDEQKRLANSIMKELEKNKGDGRIFIQPHVYSNAKEVIATLFKWYILGKLVNKSYLEVLRNYQPNGYVLIDDLLKNEKLEKSLNPQKVIVIDIDGTIFEYDKYIKNKWGKLINGAKDAIKEFRNKGFKIILYTARKEDERKGLINHLKIYNMSYDKLVMNKPIGDYYIDDRAIKFNDNWSDIQNDIQKSFPLGTIRIWKGGKYQKISQNKWNKMSEAKKTIKEEDKETEESNENVLYRNTDIGWLLDFLTNKSIKQERRDKKFISLSLDKESGSQDKFGDTKIIFNKDKLENQGAIEVYYEKEFMEMYPKISKYVTGYENEKEYYNDKDLKNADDAIKNNEFTWDEYIKSFEHEQEFVISKIKYEDELIKKVIIKNKNFDANIKKIFEKNNIKYEIINKEDLRK